MKYFLLIYKCEDLYIPVLYNDKKDQIKPFVVMVAQESKLKEILDEYIKEEECQNEKLNFKWKELDFVVNQ